MNFIKLSILLCLMAATINAQQAGRGPGRLGNNPLVAGGGSPLGPSGGNLNVTNGLTGQILTTDGAGNVYWSSPTNLTANATNAQPPSTVLTNVSNTGIQYIATNYSAVLSNATFTGVLTNGNANQFIIVNGFVNAKDGLLVTNVTSRGFTNTSGGFSNAAFANFGNGARFNGPVTNDNNQSFFTVGTGGFYSYDSGGVSYLGLAAQQGGFVFSNIFGQMFWEIRGPGVASGYPVTFNYTNIVFDSNATFNLGTYFPNLQASRPVILGADKRLTNAIGTPDGTKFVRDDGVLAVPPGTGGAGAGESNFIADAQSFITRGAIVDQASRLKVNRMFAGLTNNARYSAFLDGAITKSDIIPSNSTLATLKGLFPFAISNAPIITPEGIRLGANSAFMRMYTTNVTNYTLIFSARHETNLAQATIAQYWNTNGTAAASTDGGQQIFLPVGNYPQNYSEGSGNATANDLNLADHQFPGWGMGWYAQNQFKMTIAFGASNSTMRSWVNGITNKFSTSIPINTNSQEIVQFGCNYTGPNGQFDTASRWNGVVGWFLLYRGILTDNDIKEITLAMMAIDEQPEELVVWTDSWGNNMFGGNIDWIWRISESPALRQRYSFFNNSHWSGTVSNYQYMYDYTYGWRSPAKTGRKATVMLGGGINDFFGNRTATQVESDWLAVATRLKAEGGTIAWMPTPFTEWPYSASQTDASRSNFVASMRNQPKNYDMEFPLDKVFFQKTNTPLQDGFHPTAFGYTNLANVFETWAGGKDINYPWVMTPTTTNAVFTAGAYTNQDTDVTVYIPNGTARTNRLPYLRDIDFFKMKDRIITVYDFGGTASGTNIYVTTQGGERINGATSVAINTDYGFKSFIADNSTNWLELKVSATATGGGGAGSMPFNLNQFATNGTVALIKNSGVTNPFIVNDGAGGSVSGTNLVFDGSATRYYTNRLVANSGGITNLIWSNLGNFALPTYARIWAAPGVTVQTPQFSATNFVGGKVIALSTNGGGWNEVWVWREDLHTNIQVNPPLFDLAFTGSTNFVTSTITISQAGSPGGSTGSIQLNNGGAFDGTNSFIYTWSEAAMTLFAGSSPALKIISGGLNSSNVLGHGFWTLYTNGVAVINATHQNGGTLNVASNLNGAIITATNRLDVGGTNGLLELAYNGLTNLVASATNGGSITLRGTLSPDQNMTNTITFNQATRMFQFKVGDTNVAWDGATESWAPLVFNGNTFTLTNGVPVYQCAVTNDTTMFRPLVALASSRTYAESRLLGVTTMDIPAGGYGWVTTLGSVNGVNLLALTPGGVATNNFLYLNVTPGTYTTNNNPENMTTNWTVAVGKTISTNIVMLQNAPDPVFDRPVTATVTTTDATATSIYAITPPNNSTIVLETTLYASTVAAGSATNASASYKFFTTVVTTNNTTRIGGTTGAAISSWGFEDITAWHCFWTNQTATTAALRGIGVAATSIKWVSKTVVSGTPAQPAY